MMWKGPDSSRDSVSSDSASRDSASSDSSSRDSVSLEPVEQIDSTGEVVAVVSRAEMRANNLLHRMVAVVVMRRTGSIVAHQRAHWKDVHPLKWDVAFGGVPSVGETDLDAARRELAEEAGLDLTPDCFIELASLRSTDDHTRWIGRFYVVTTDDPVTPSDGEVAQFAEVSLKDLATWAEQMPLCDDALRVVVPMMLDCLPLGNWQR